MKKTLIALTAIVTLAGLANADVIRSEATGLIAGDRIMTVEAAQQCWQEQMEKLFTDFEPQRKGTPLWQPIARPIAKFQALTAKSTTSMQWEALVARPVEGFRGGPAEDFAQDRGRHQTRPGPRGGMLVIAREVGWALGPFSDSCVPVSLAPARRMALIKVGG